MHSKEDFQKRILVVEDEGLIAADIQRRIERLGYPKPVIAGSAEQALQCARSTPFDLVLHAWFCAFRRVPARRRR